ncbi:MAG: hypothetical protein M9891_06060 [Austwickia sp.]|nr:hypothetical protein [Austwickia sp.]
MNDEDSDGGRWHRDAVAEREARRQAALRDAAIIRETGADHDLDDLTAWATATFTMDD